MSHIIYWVPENCMFENDGDCLDKFPELGAAALVYSQSAYEVLEAKYSKYEAAIKEINQALMNCHEQLAASEDRASRFGAALRKISDSFGAGDPIDLAKEALE